MSHYVTTSKASALLYQARVSKLMGYPSRGVHVGGGRHVDIPETYSDGAPGWTAHAHAVVEHPKDKTYAHPIVDPDKVGDAKALTATELAYLQDKTTTGQELDDSWTADDTVTAAVTEKER